MRFPPRSLRRRILVESLVALFVVGAIGLLAYSVALQRILQTVAEDDARGQLNEVSMLLTDGRLTPERVEEEVGSHGSIIQVVDASGRVVGSSSTPPTTPAVSTLRPAPGATDSARVAGPSSDDGRPWIVVAAGVQPQGTTAASQRLVVLVAEPLQAGSAIVSTATLWLGAAALVVLVVVGLLLHRTVGVALQPVRRINAEVEEIRTARRSGRVTVADSADEIARLGEVMNAMLDRLETADAATRQFVSDASHELRSPLATIRAVVEGEPSPPGSRAHERDLVIGTEVLRMQRLVDDLLTLAKADDARLDLAREEVDLDDVVDQEVRRLRATARVRVAADIEAARVVGDAGRLHQALRNLTDNAVRHARGAVTVRVRSEGDEAIVTVDNDGSPVEPSLREAVFERFARLEEARERDGTSATPEGSGLGLPIARALVEAHGGTLRIVDAPDASCRFEARLPLADPA